MKNRDLQNWLPIILTMFLVLQYDESLSQKLDSLKDLLNNSQGAARCSILLRLALEAEKIDGKMATEFASDALECAQLQHDTSVMIKAVRIRAYDFRQMGEFDSSNALILAVLPIARKEHDYDEMKHLIHALGLGLSFVGRYDEALSYNFEALELRRKHGNPTLVAATLNNIGLVYYKLRDYKKAVEYYTYSLREYASEPGNEKVANTELINIALSYAYLGELSKADSTVAEARRNCKNDCPAFDLINIDFCKGVVELARQDTAAAKSHFLNSYKLAKESTNERLELDNIIYLSQIYLGTREISEAEYYLGKAEELIQTGVPYNMELMKIYKELARLYERKGDYRRVAEFQRRYIAFRDSTQSEEMTLRLMKIEAKHAEEAKTAEIQSQKRMLELNEKVILRQRVATIFAFSTAALFAGFVALLIRSVREKKTRNADLEQRVKHRTAELESIVRQSHKMLSEKRMWIEKMLSSVRHSTNTVNGLSVLIKNDTESLHKCSLLLTQEMAQLLNEVNAYATRSFGENDDGRIVV